MQVPLECEIGLAGCSLPRAFGVRAHALQLGCFSSLQLQEATKTIGTRGTHREILPHAPVSAAAGGARPIPRHIAAAAYIAQQRQWPPAPGADASVLHAAPESWPMQLLAGLERAAATAPAVSAMRACAASVVDAIGRRDNIQTSCCSVNRSSLEECSDFSCCNITYMSHACTQAIPVLALALKAYLLATLRPLGVQFGLNICLHLLHARLHGYFRVGLELFDTRAAYEKSSGW